MKFLCMFKIISILDLLIPQQYVESIEWHKRLEERTPERRLWDD